MNAPHPYSVAGSPAEAALQAALAAAPGPGLLCRLDHLGLIAVSGDDAAQFLHNQLTNDVLHQAPGVAEFNAFCTPKGRMQASFIGWSSRRDDQPMQYLLMSRDIQAPVQKRLAMFVLRSRARLTDANDAIVAFGVIGKRGAERLGAHFDVLPEGPMRVVERNGQTLIRVADVLGEPRWIWLVPSDFAGQTDGASDAEIWRWTDIQAGIPWIAQGVQEQFVPQMINFEALGGVNFKKGCYPGQEVVARSQYLGKLKRRMALASVDVKRENGPLATPGAPVFQSARRDEPSGTLVAAAYSPAGSLDMLVELSLAATQDGSLHLGSPDGPALTLLPLPYVLPDNEVFIRPKL